MTIEDWLEGEDVVGLKQRLETGCGSLLVYAYFDTKGNLRSVHLDDEGLCGCSSLLHGLSRMITLAAENGIHIKDIAVQLNRTVTCSKYTIKCVETGGVSDGMLCCPSAIAFALMDMWTKVKEIS